MLEDKVRHLYRNDNKGTDIDWLLITDFGDRYSGATIASAATLVAGHNNKHNTDYRLRPTVLKPYPSFDIQHAATQVKQDLDRALREKGNNYPLYVTFVVDPEKDRKNVLTEWNKDGTPVFIAHPDHGQITQLLDDPHWSLKGAVEIDKHRIIPDSEIAHERYQLWDGHAAYAPAAVVAALHSGILAAGELKDYLRRYTDRTSNIAELESVPVHQQLTQRAIFPGGDHRRNRLVHYIGNNFEGFIEHFPDSIFCDEFITYESVKDWYAAGYNINFAGINIFRDADVDHLIVYDAPGEQLVADLDTGSDARIRLVTPNNESASLLVDAYPISRYDIVPGQLKGNYGPRIFANNGKVRTNGAYKVHEHGDTYNAPVLSGDGNGNIVVRFNPYALGIAYDEVEAIKVTQKGKDLGIFVVQKDYSDRAGLLHYAGSPVGAILNPAHCGVDEHGEHIATRRPNLELFCSFWFDAVPVRFAGRVSNTGRPS